MYEHSADELLQILASGESLTPEGVTEVRIQIQKAPDDFASRLMLIGYLQHNIERAFCAPLYDQIAWFVQAFPEHPVLSNSSMRLIVHPKEHEYFERIRALWKSAVVHNPSALQILMNAGYQMLVNDCPRAEEYANQALQLAPEDSNAKQLAASVQKMKKVQSSTFLLKDGC